MNEQLLIILFSFGTVASLTFCVVQFMSNRESDGKLRDRLSSDDGSSFEAARFNKVFSQLSKAASRPFMPSDLKSQFVVRRSLARAGIYTPSGIRTVAAAKAICLVLGIVVGYLVGSSLDYVFLCLPIGGLIGYILPLIWLKIRTKSNQLALTNGLADALDLMVVCIEAGLTIDAAMQRVGQELATAHPSVSRELGLTHMETRVGLSRAEALRNLGQRTGNPALISLASMLIQAERFGSSIANALRVHSETLRINRQAAAEEMAGKASVKMSFPLVLCIFPSTFIVLAGPTIIQLMKSAMFK
jgi:tight adherence protein C